MGPENQSESLLGSGGLVTEVLISKQKRMSCGRGVGGTCPRDSARGSDGRGRAALGFRARGDSVIAGLTVIVSH